MKLNLALTLAALILAIAFSLESRAAQSPNDCDEMTIYNYSTAMCEGKAMAGMPMTMIMAHGNLFVTGDLEEGPRAQNKVAAPNMLMADAGTTIGDRNYLNLDVMLTAERWAFPKQGYPLLLQIGEENEDHEPFLDAQHPHSSPIMGLTLSDTYSLNATDHIKVFAAPRGAATDGPTAFMHRPSGEVNPDAPLGHHIGQDVGHISSSVVGVEYRRNKSNLEFSTFSGQEPEPTKVDLPTYTPDSYAFRFTQQLNREIHAMASAAYVKNPEHDLDHLWRYSLSIYTNTKFLSGWEFHDAFIYGLVNFYDHAGALNSFLYEAALEKEKSTVWGRFEALERTPDELSITQSNDRSTGRYVELLTLGYTHALVQHNVNIGASVSKDFLPIDYQRDYGGNPLTAKIFAEVSGHWMNER